MLQLTTKGNHSQLSLGALSLKIIHCSNNVPSVHKSLGLLLDEDKLVHIKGPIPLSQATSRYWGTDYIFRRVSEGEKTQSRSDG